MQIDVLKPFQETVIFGILFFTVLFFTIRRKQGTDVFPIDTTNEIKGFAMIAIILSHIGYFLSRQTDFLFPFSIYAGVSVDLFLFLSGYGLAVSALKNQLSIKEFYKKRVAKLFIPLWTVLILFFLADYFFLHKIYPLQDILLSFFGIFPHADLFQDVNSPLWYITWTLFYYILFPFFFSQKRPLLSAMGIYLAGWLVLQTALPVSAGVFGLYQVHAVAFPFGIAAAVLFQKYATKLQKLIEYTSLRRLLLLVLCGAFVYFGLHSEIGNGYIREQAGSIFLLSVCLFVFLFKKVQFRLLSVFGIYSYELYLLHWPILYRYDFLYKHLPAGVATALYFGILLCLAFLLSHILNKLSNFSKKIQKES
jgi:peptidoglycan/LPS O-acetylase OafA/YrhL